MYKYNIINFSFNIEWDGTKNNDLIARHLIFAILHAALMHDARIHTLSLIL